MEDNIQNANSEPAIPENIHVPSIVDKLESRLDVGQVVQSVDDAYVLYCNYAHAKGFSVKRADHCYFLGTKELKSKDFECSCEGHKDEKRSNGRTNVYLKPSIRSGCKASLKISRQRGEEWKVCRFVKEHNHEMVAFDQRHLLRSSRTISYAQKCTLEAMVNAGISVANAVSYMENEAQGSHNLGFIRKDAYDHLRRIKKLTQVVNEDDSVIGNGLFIEFGGNEDASIHESEMVFVDQMIKSAFALIMQCKAHEKARDKLKEIIDGASKQIDDLLESLKFDDNKACDSAVQERNNMFDNLLVCNPPQVKSRGITNLSIQLLCSDKGKKRVEEGKVDESNAKCIKTKGQYLETSQGPNIINSEASQNQQLQYPTVPTSRLD